MTCSIAGCEKAKFATGLCGMHYKRVRRSGDALGLRRIATDPDAVEKTCLMCGVLYPLEGFPASRINRDGREGICRGCYSAESRRRNLWRKYGLTLDDFDSMRETQGDRCLICQQIGGLVVDHDHATGIVRGLLCQACNKLLGCARDSAAVLARAIDYLASDEKDFTHG